MMRWCVAVLLCGSMLTGCGGIRFDRVRANFTGEALQSGSVQIGTIEDGWAIVEARINGQGPYRLMLDTGADLTMLRSDVFEQIRSGSLGNSTIRDIHGFDKSYAVHELDTIELNGVRLESVPVITGTKLDALYEQYGWDGLLGYSGIDDFTLDLDYEAGVVRLSTERLRQGDRGVMRMVARDGKTPIVALTHTGPVAGEEFTKRYGIDTGGDFLLSIPGPDQARLVDLNLVRRGGMSVGMNSVQKDNHLGRLRGGLRIVGDAEREKSMAGISISGIPVDLDLKNTLIGNGLLSRFHVMIDPVSRLVRITNGDSFGSLVRMNPMQGIGVLDWVLLDDQVLLMRIGDQSPAMLAGLRPGTMVYAIDGKAVTDPEVRRGLGFVWDEPRTLQLLVDRGEERREVEVGTEPFFADGLGERGPDLELPKLNPTVRILPPKY